jgi:hypothetical protein
LVPSTIKGVVIDVAQRVCSNGLGVGGGARRWWRERLR